MTKTKIDWCDYTWNPVWGCRNNCEYCYARKIAKRFAGKIAKNECIFEFTGKTFKESEFYNRKYILERKIKNFQPVWLEKNFQKNFPKKPSRIFVDSMSDIRFWEPEWFKLVLDKIKEYPQHTFIFLTKFPEIYDKYVFPKNCWLGYSSSLGDDFYPDFFHEFNNIKFVSIEPLLSEIDGGDFLNIIHTLDWIIIGAQTNPYKPPKKEWIDEIVKYANLFHLPVFMKNNLKKVYPNLIQEFPG